MDAVDHRPRGVFVAEISAKCRSAVARGGELSDKFLRAVERGVGVDGDLVAAVCKFLNNDAADADAATSNKRHALFIMIRHAKSISHEKHENAQKSKSLSRRRKEN